MAALAVLLFLSTVAVVSAPLAEPDEARYAEVAREMVSGGDWIVPRLNGEVFLDKPPLVFWAEAASLRLFGVRDWAARLPVLIAAILCLFIVYLLARELFGVVTGWFAVLLLATAPLFFGMGQVLTLDLPLTLWTTAAMAAIWFGHSRASPSWYRVAYLCTALGALTKGPVAVLLVWLPAALFLLDRGEKNAFRRAIDPLGILLFLIVSLPWFALAEMHEPGFLLNFVRHHHIERFVNPWQHREPFWFFVPVLLAGLFPWSLLWILERRGAGQALERILRSPQGVFAAVFAAVPLLFFSASSSKLIPYILPALPPLALLLAELYASLFRSHGGRLSKRGGAAYAVVGVGLLLTGVSFFLVEPHWRAPLVRPFLMAGGVAFSLLGGLAACAGARGHGRAAFALLAAAMISSLALMQSGRGLAKSYRALARGGEPHLAPEAELFSYRHQLPGVEFYLRRRITVIERGDEAVLASRWQAARPPAVFVRASEVATLTRLLPDAAVVATAFDTALIVHNQALVAKQAPGPPSIGRE